MQNEADLWTQNARQCALAEAVDLELPSGTVIKARRPGLMILAGWGRLPMGLAQAASGNGTSIEKQSDEETVSFAEFLRTMLLYCVVKPAISLRPGNDEIHPHIIPNEDVNYILAWALRGPEAVSLESFRTRRIDGSAGAGSSQTADAAIDTAGNN